eukprot:2380521-Pyramimonas_sp.AAC.1
MSELGRAVGWLYGGCALLGTREIGRAVFGHDHGPYAVGQTYYPPLRVNAQIHLPPIQACSMKPAPGKDVTRQLWENYLKDGFVTSGEPLLVSQPEELQVRPEPPLPAPTAHAPHSL